MVLIGCRAVGQTDGVHARSAVVDLYGDHLSHRGWWAPVSSVVGLAESVAVQAPATRTAISRLAAQGWLRAQMQEGVRGYAATPRARDRWRHAHDRIYATGPAPWDGRWHLVQVDTAGDRRLREQVASTLGYLGYGRAPGGGWLSPWRSPELSASLEGLGVRWLSVQGSLDGPTGAARLVASVWDLAGLAEAYDDFLAGVPAVPTDPGPREAYVLRTHLVHAWRRFLFQDPGLPQEVLPSDWVGHRARTAFLDLAAALAPAAGVFVDQALTGRLAGHER